MKQNSNYAIDFIGVGARKAGTTWIADCLWGHPEICISQPKEINYFNEILTTLLNTRNRNFNKSMKWYMQHYAHCREGRKKGEFCVNYLKDPKAAYRIKDLFPDVKIIICLRDPVDRAYSDYNMFHHYVSREKTATFEAAIAKNPNYLKSSLYFDDVKKFIQLFGREKVHCILMDDIKVDPKSVIFNLYGFLGVAQDFSPYAIKGASNESKYVKFKYFGRFVFHVKRIMVRLKLNSLLELMKITGMDQKLMQIGSKEYKFGKVNLSTRSAQIGYFLKDIEKLESLMDRDLSVWKK